MSLTAVNLDNGATGAVLASGSVADANPTLDVLPPPAGEITDFPDTEGVRWAAYLASLHTDPDGNAELNTGEVYTAVSSALVIWLEADDALPAQLVLLGLRLGYNALAFDGPVPTVVDTNALPITVIPPSDEATISGTAKPDGERFAVAPGVDFETGDFGDDLLYDEVLGATWSITVKGLPPARHQLGPNRAGLPPEYAVEQPIIYTDSDESESLTKGDELGTVMCNKDGALAQLWYLPRNANLGLTLSTQGQSGWLIFLADPDGEDEIDLSAFVTPSVADLEPCPEDKKTKTSESGTTSDFAPTTITHATLRNGIEAMVNEAASR